MDTATNVKALRSPFAVTKLEATSPVTRQELSVLVSDFRDKTIGESFLGPAWVAESGMAYLVFIAADGRLPLQVRQAGGCAFIAWIWTDVPSAPLSLTVMVQGGARRPHTRWMRPCNDPIVQAIRRSGRFMMIVANTQGHASPWFEAVFTDEPDPAAPASTEKLEKLFELPIGGIARSSIHEHRDPLIRHETGSRIVEGELPLWPEPVSDYWKTLHYDGPWAKDLTARDRAMATWGREAWARRSEAARCIHDLAETCTLGEVRPLFDERGALRQQSSSLHDWSLGVLEKNPLVGEWLAAIAGPAPDAARAHELTYGVLRDPSALYAFLAVLMGPLQKIDSGPFAVALKAVFEAALLDTRITHCGTRRPWFSSRLDAIDLMTMEVDLSASLEDIECLWRSGQEILNLIDAGRTLTPADFPVPGTVTMEAFKETRLEGSIEQAEETIRILLNEAQAARMWSIPWGARVEVNIGPFVAARIFESAGEFSIYFLDEQDRYFQVAIGLAAAEPRIVPSHIVRMDADGDACWNDDAELALSLVAAAIVRDFLVVEERETLFSQRPFRRRIRGRNVRTIIYLPRVAYSAAPNLASMAPEPSVHSHARHPVAAHLRRSATISPAQRFLADRYGIRVPEGFTFVRAHERGGEAEQARIRVYRSRSASQMIYERVDRAPEGTRPAWFEFEKDCARLLRSRGLEVIHRAAQRDGDGGMDLYAVEPGGQSWVVQCKCWSAHRPVGPDVVRELEGAIRLADKGTTGTSRGMIITTSSFTSGAVETAAALDFELISGEMLAQLERR